MFGRHTLRAARAWVSRVSPGYVSRLQSTSSSSSISFLSSSAWTTTRNFSSDTQDKSGILRNFGISAHIDSGKTTLTERILYYTGRIRAIHEVGGKDEVGAKMDSMELERERGITIASAATHTQWGDTPINIIDTPGHVDFTIEVERALRVLDGAILLVCGSSGVQSQTLTVDKQMKRYNVPRICFVNKLDRLGADAFSVVQQVRDNLQLNAALCQVPIGLEKEHRGVIDLLERKALYFDGDNGETVRVEDEIPEFLQEQVEETRQKMIELLADADENIAEQYLMEEEPSIDEIHAAIRRCTIAGTFVPVFCGSAYKNKGVQPLLDAVVRYLPAPNEIDNIALDQKQDEKEIILKHSPSEPLVMLAFKLEEGKFGQLTYCRVYQGSINRGDTILNTTTNKKVKITRLVKMHSNEMEDVNGAGPGEIIALFGVDCASGTTFTTDNLQYSMSTMFVPSPVISYSIKPKKSDMNLKFGKALTRFTKEDPTFHAHYNDESGETVISGMGELHLDIYRERLLREYDVDCVVGQPKVAYRETITQRSEFNYLHKKQSGGKGQYGRVIGYIEPIEEGSKDFGKDFVYENQCVGNNIPPEFQPAVEKGFQEGASKGIAIGHPISGVRVVLLDGQAHMVDSNELSFRIAAQHAFRSAFLKANPQVLEPVMSVEVDIPSEFQTGAVGGLNRRKGMINNVTQQLNGTVHIKADVPLSQMFGYSTDLRGSTEGKGEFSMEFDRYEPISRDVTEQMMKEYQLRRHSGDDE